MEVVIRRAVVADAPEILALQKLAYYDEAVLYNAFEMPPLTETVEEIEAEFVDHIFLKAVAGDKLVGSVRARMIEDDTCYVGRLAVHPEHQGHHTGTGLMIEIDKYFPEAKKFALYTGYKSTRNIHIYEKLGYRVADRRELAPDVFLLFMVKAARQPVPGRVSRV